MIKQYREDKEFKNNVLMQVLTGKMPVWDYRYRVLCKKGITDTYPKKFSYYWKAWLYGIVKCLLGYDVWINQSNVLGESKQVKRFYGMDIYLWVLLFLFALECGVLIFFLILFFLAQ